MKRIKLLAVMGLSFTLLLQGFSCTGFASSTKETGKAGTAEEARAAGQETAETDAGGTGGRILKDLPTSWDLTVLYADQAAFEDDMKRVEELIPEIETLKGTLNSVEGILNDLENPKLKEINAILNKAGMYAGLLSDLNAADPLAGKISARLSEVEQKVSLAYSFEEPEIMEMPLEKRQEIFSDERLAPYAYCFRKYTDPDYVVLGEEASMVAVLMGTGQNSYETHDIFDNIDLPRPTFTYPDGTEGVLTDDVYSQIIESTEYDHAFRKKINELRNSMRQPYANTYASLLEGAMRSYWANAQIHKYNTTLEAALDSNDVDPEIYDKVIEFAHSLLPKVQEYYAAKKEILGLDEMMVCDLLQPVSAYEPKKTSYEEAVNDGRAGIAVWGDEYLSVFDRIMESSHIDVYPSSTKTSGAFETLMGNETTPFVLYNFNGLESYTSTIVHEMGHAVYSQLSAENQNEYNNNPTSFTQEVASTANEILFHKAKIAQAQTDEEKLYWMDQEINLFLSTIVRQCMYSEFEDYCYKTIEGGGALDTSEMAQKWIELEKEYYGELVSIYEDSGIDWARISHMYYDYYVYQYATSITYAASICEKVEEKGEEEIDAYLKFLKAGNSASPAELLAIAGVDPLKDATYEAAGSLITGLIDEFIAKAGK